MPADAATALRGACPVVASFGQQDRALRGAPGAWRRRCAAGVEHDVKAYPGVGHAFLNDFRGGPGAVAVRLMGARFDTAAAGDARARIVAFFRQHLRATPADAARYASTAWQGNQFARDQAGGNVGPRRRRRGGRFAGRAGRPAAARAAAAIRHGSRPAASRPTASFGWSTAVIGGG